MFQHDVKTYRKHKKLQRNFADDWKVLLLEVWFFSCSREFSFSSRCMFFWLLLQNVLSGGESFVKDNGTFFRSFCCILTYVKWIQRAECKFQLARLFRNLCNYSVRVFHRQLFIIFRRLANQAAGIYIIACKKTKRKKIFLIFFRNSQDFRSFWRWENHENAWWVWFLVKWQKTVELL